MDHISYLLCVVEFFMEIHLRFANEVQISNLGAYEWIPYFHHFLVNEMAHFWRGMFITNYIFIGSYYFFIVHGLSTALHEEILTMFGEIATPNSYSILCSSWIALLHRGFGGFPSLFDDFDHMEEVAYPYILIFSCILDVNMHVRVLGLPHFEYYSSVLRVVV